MQQRDRTAALLRGTAWSCAGLGWLYLASEKRDCPVEQSGVESMHLKVAAFRRCTLAHTWLHG